MASDDKRIEPVEILVTDAHVGERLDAFLVQYFPQYSRVHLRRAIQAGGVQVDGRNTKAAYRLRAAQRVVVVVPELPRESPQPEPIPLDILFEDEHLVAVNKPPNMVVHPAKGHWSGTLASALAHHFEQLSAVGGPTRPGIVHRLDRETSGVLVVAKTDAAHHAIAAQFEARTTEKEYFAIVAGIPDRDRDVIEQPIGVHPYHREKMAIRSGHSTSRAASTFYEVLQRFRAFAALRVFPKTGRTHQIRVHLTHAGCPVLCDRLYSGRANITRGEISKTEDQRLLLARQALHARRLKINHPATGRPIEFEAALPEDLRQTVEFLQAHRDAT